ncbi:hypothetical protein HDV00_001665 [Rhizophlyctis rosea]|nr:hypothetical protein HDV00_001665 [Rhizophlyctis rosea]
MAASLENLRRLLGNLYDSVSDSSTAGLADTKALSTDVKTILVGELGPADSALALSLLFHAERGVLQFLKVTRGSKVHVDAKAILLESIAEYGTKFPAGMKEYAVEIKNICVALFGSKESSKVQKATFNPLFMLLDPRMNLNDEDLEVAKLFKTYFNAYIQQATKITATVKSLVLELLGFITRYYPASVDERQRLQLQRFYIQALESLFNVRGKEPDLPLVAGAMRGLDHYLFSLAGDDKIASKDLNLVFKALKHVLQPTEDLTRYAVPMAGLQMVIDHSSMLGPLLYSEYRTMYSYLLQMNSHRNRDLHKLGFNAVDAFLREVATTLMTLAKGKAETECFWFFLKHFSDALKNPASSLRDVSLAIRGFGLFAAPCKNFLDQNEVLQILDILLKKSSFLFSDANDNQDEITGQLPAFLEAFAYICKELPIQDEAFMMGIEQTVGTLLVNFPKLGRSLRPPSVAAFVKLLFALYSNVAGFQSFWSKLAFDALVLTCTDVLAEGILDDDSMELPEHAYENYLYFWESIFSEANVGVEDGAEAFFVAVYDITMTAILRFPDSLNLQTVNVNDEESDTIGKLPSAPDVPLSGDVSQLRASNPKDFALFVNFVEFCKLFLTRVRTENFARWVSLAGEKWIDASTKRPLVSGFYKLLAVNFELCEQINFFRGFGKSGAVSIESSDNTEEEKASPQYQTYILYRKYVKEVSVRMENYKDDLLASCLRLVLSIPKELLIVSDLVAPLKLALKMGLSYPPLALIALDALDKIVAHVPLTLLDAPLGHVLPAMTDYLMIEVDASAEVIKSAGRNRRKAPSKRPAAVAKTDTSSTTQAGKTRNALTADISATVGQLRTVRSRMVRLLGRIGRLNHHLVTRPEGEALISWDTEKHIRFNVPFKEVNVSIFIDDMLPRILDIAENGTDRKAKVAAGELLHALVLLMVGRSAQALEAKESQFSKLYLKIFPCLLRLAVDVEKITRDLFRQLVMQLIHCVASSNGPLRDFGAECAAEFLKYSIKQSSTKMAENPLNAKSLFKRLYQFCQHTSSNKRVGAALIVIRIYKLFREEEPLIDQFAFELLYNLLCNLKLAEIDNQALGSRQIAVSAISHVAKIIRKRSDLFRSATPARRGFEGLSQADIPSLVEWLFTQIGSIESAYAHQCMVLLMEFVPEFTTPRKWISSKLSDNPGCLLEILETAPFRNRPTGTLTLQKARPWLRHYMAAVDAYAFLCDAGLIDPATLWEHRGAQIIDSINFFFTSVTNVSVVENNSILTPGDVFILNEMRASAVIKTFLLIQVILSKPGSENCQVLANSKIWNTDFFATLGNCVFCPSRIGFNMESAEVKRELPGRIQTLLNLLRAKLSAKDRREMLKIQAELYWSNGFDITSAKWEQTSEIYPFAQAIGGLHLLQEVQLFDAFVEAATRKATYSDELVVQMKKMATSAEPQTIAVVHRLLDFCLNNTETVASVYEDSLASIDGVSYPTMREV